ncbi:MAG: hypothetical protein KC477_17285 [Oceanospirillaceae bacterium]|nr:hypothetical protein [Oceanospirillaceae bacterium]
MGITTVEMTYAEWEVKFQPKVINASGENALLIEDEFEAEALMSEVGETYVWTRKYADEGEGELIVNGLWSVGAVGFMVSSIAYSEDEDYVVTV